jgi:hypothetical protein
VAKLIAEGGFSAVESDYPIPETGITREAVRRLLGLPVVAYQTPMGGWLFARKASPDLVGTSRPNLRASALCGWLIYGQAIHTLPTDLVIWHEDSGSLPNTTLAKVVSGGQTGADRGALIAAKAAGIATGGWMPKYFLALDGSHPDFADLYGIREHKSDRYPPRTEQNVRDSDGTLKIASDFNSPGEKLTAAMCDKHGKPQCAIHIGGKFNIPPIEHVATWIAENRIRILNVAGNSERTSPGIQKFTEEYLTRLFQSFRIGS